jgi:hypothetical protein
MLTAICIASGPSLTQEDVDYCRGKGRVYVVKECGLAAPWADVLYAADTDWITDNKDRWEDFHGEKWTVSDRAAHLHPEWNYIAAKPEKKFSITPGEIATGGNSGFQIINLAVLQGAQRVVLLGFDYGYDPSRQNKHWWDEEFPRKSRESNYASWNKRMVQAAPFIPVTIVNASRQSAITCFPRIDLKDALL